jgi:hypothetical protein
MHRTGFEVVISLLCGYFTCFVHDEYLFSGSDYRADNKEDGTCCSIASFKSSWHRLNADLISSVASGLATYFPGKKYAPHSLLTSHFIFELFPFPYAPEYTIPNEKVTLFKLLFDSREDFGRMTIA